MATAEKGRAAAEPWRGYFAVQLRFAEVFAARSAKPLAEAYTFCTNIHRRLGYGNLASMAPAPAFQALVACLLASDPSDRPDLVVAAYAAQPAEELPPEDRRFGCFSFDPPDATRRVRIHFGNRDSEDGTGPLAPRKVETRRQELRAMFRHIVHAHPDATSVAGGSWAYQLERYRSLFPQDFAESRRPPERAALHGSASWGQLLDFRGRLKPALTEALLRNLTSCDLAKPWLAFPLPMLVTQAPLASFVRAYGL